MPKVFNSPPLPFVGQKRNWVKTFRNLLTENIPDAGDGWTVVDVFGGSGILSDVAKRTLPKARVIYNDFDNYHERLEHIRKLTRCGKSFSLSSTAVSFAENCRPKSAPV